MVRSIRITNPRWHTATIFKTQQSDRQSHSPISNAIFGRPFVKRFALCYQTVVCLSVCPVCLSLLSCLSVTFVHCGQTAGRIMMKLGMQLGLGPGHIVLDGDPAPPPPKGQSPLIFGPYLLWQNGCMDQDATSYGARPWTRRLCVRWRLSFPLKKGHSAPNFRPMSIVAKRLDRQRCCLIRR